MSLRRDIPWRWITVLAVIGVAFQLGYRGFQEHLAAAGHEKSSRDVAYLTVQLFFLESGAVDGAVGWKLEVARFLAPLTTAYALVQAVLEFCAIQLKSIWLRWRGGHVVICGLGRKGARLVQELRKLGRQVIVIEHDPDNDDLQHCRASGAVVVVGAANDEWTLRKAHVHQADSLIAVTGDDSANIETAVLTHLLNRRRSRQRKPLQCVVHVTEPRLRRLFEGHRIFGNPHDLFDLQLMNTYEVAARVMLREPPVLLPLDGLHGPPPHLLLVGLGTMGEALLCRALKDWQIDHPDRNERLPVTVVDVDAEVRAARFRLRYSGLCRSGQLQFIAMDAHSPEFGRGAFLQLDVADPLSPAAAPPFGQPSGISAAYVCLNRDADTLAAALTLQRLFHLQPVPIIAQMSQQTGLATLLASDRHANSAISGLRAVGLQDLTCLPEVVLGGPAEILAQSIHQAYLYDRLTEGQSFGVAPPMVSWDRLEPSFKESNRSHARDVPRKLASVGCEMVPSLDEEIELFEFRPDEVERLAKDEHDRWVKERQAAGWTYGPQKDQERRFSPSLVPWTELPEDIKDYDRKLILRLPANLAKADYAIRRIPASRQSLSKEM